MSALLDSIIFNNGVSEQELCARGFNESYFARAEAAQIEGKAICLEQLPARISPATHVQAADRLEPTALEVRRTTDKLAVGSLVSPDRGGGNIRTASAPGTQPARNSISDADEVRVREILTASIERQFPGAGQVLRNMLNELTVEQLRGVLRTLVNSLQEKSVAEYLRSSASICGKKSEAV
jgi:hypothetical protein